MSRTVSRQKFAAYSCVASDLHVTFNVPIVSINKHSALQPVYWEKVLVQDDGHYAHRQGREVHV
jgi:hypothetical protein